MAKRSNQKYEQVDLSIERTGMATLDAQLQWPRLDQRRRADVLEAIATALEGRREDVLQTTSDETALTIEELTPEFTRMIGTLRMFEGLIRDGSWVRAAIDRPASEPSNSVGPNHDVRRMLVPLGIVAVFGASNFPLAYGVCGGDTASAMAAGCPVIVKEHPAHPKTGRLIHEIASSAAAGAGAPANLLSYVHHEDPSDFSIAARVVKHCPIHAVGFTGSVNAGLAIEKLARERNRPVPVFAEMGSNNVVVVTGAAAAVRAEQIAEEIAASILQRFGQQCTRPGTIVVEPTDAGTRLVNHLAKLIEASPGRDMLSSWIKGGYERRLREVEACGGVRVAARGATKSGPRGSGACLFSVDDLFADRKNVFDQETLRDEVFGPAAVVVRALMDMVGDVQLYSSLTYSIYFEPSDRGTIDLLAPMTDASGSAGRIIFNGVPTGVRVAHGMVHGGPFPATNRPDTTAVGPMAIERWCRPVCFQNCPQELLPPELQDANPLGITRLVNGELTRAPITP